MLIDTIPEDLDELFENRRLAAIAFLRKSCGVVVMTVHIAIVLVIAIRCAENRWADAACEMLDMILSI